MFDRQLPPEPSYPSLVPSVAESALFKETGGGSGAPDLDDVTENDGIAIKRAPPGPCYELLTNNVPTGLMKLTINSWPPGTEQYVKHNILAEYIQDTAIKTGVNEVSHFNTKVEHVFKEEGSWKIQTSTLVPATLGKTVKNWEFDAVVMATGHYYAPKVPDIPDCVIGRVIGPQEYSTRSDTEVPESLKASTSSFDIAKELQGIAKTIYQSTRNGAFDHPISMLPPEVIRIPEITSFNIESSLDRKSGHSAIPGTVILVNSQVLGGIDRVIIATGYHCTFPFLSEYHQDSVPLAEAGQTTLVTDGTQMHNLHKDIFYIPDPTLAFVGVPFHTATFSLFEFQAITVAAVFPGKAKLPKEDDLRVEYIKKVQEKGFGRSFHSLQGMDVGYVNGLLAWINRDIIAAGGKPIEGHTKEWKSQYEALLLNFKALLDRGPQLQSENEDLVVATASDTIVPEPVKLR